jgi:hypothetical protein
VRRSVYLANLERVFRPWNPQRSFGHLTLKPSSKQGLMTIAPLRRDEAESDTCENSSEISGDPRLGPAYELLEHEGFRETLDRLTGHCGNSAKLGVEVVELPELQDAQNLLYRSFIELNFIHVHARYAGPEQFR